MYRLILLGTSLIFSTNAIANSYDVNCESLEVSLSNSLSYDNFQVNAKWTNPSEFPNPPETIEVGDGMYRDLNTSSSFKINCPTIAMTYDGNVFEANGDTFEEVLKHLFRGYNSKDRPIGPFNIGLTSVNFFFHRWYLYPTIKVDSRVNKYSFDLSSLEFISGVRSVEEGDTVDSFSTGINEGTVIGYKVDGKALKPLLYDFRINEYKKELKDASVIDIYHKNPDAGHKGKQIQRIYIDKANGILKIYRKYDFPSS